MRCPVRFASGQSAMKPHTSSFACCEALWNPCGNHGVLPKKRMTSDRTLDRLEGVVAFTYDSLVPEQCLC